MLVQCAPQQLQQPLEKAHTSHIAIVAPGRATCISLSVMIIAQTHAKLQTAALDRVGLVLAHASKSVAHLMSLDTGRAVAALLLRCQLCVYCAAISLSMVLHVAGRFDAFMLEAC